jgi:ankyrin repeat protein
MDECVRYRGEKRPLIDACHNGHEGVVKVLLQYGADTLEPALEIVAGKGRLDLVRLLLEHGAECGEAVERAAAGSYLDVVEELPSRGADVNSRSADLLVICGAVRACRNVSSFDGERV